ncbi:PAS domain-containing protein [Amycolatopsis sp. WGS_07]|uniref:PAS domain-containing protein n=1 Tax=Amycolatopsis sp. WGS_07 TaxID=3076764 RepID=UPI003873114A
MAGRPWGAVQAEDEVVRGAALWLRDLMKRSGRTVREVAAACECAPSTVSARINGAAGPQLKFCDQVIEACLPRAEWPVQKKELRKLLGRRPVPAREPVVPDARTRVLEAQAETARAQAQTVRVLSELSLAKDQLLAGMRLEFQAQQIITALRAVLVHLVGSGASAAEDEAEAKFYLERARDERGRAERLADDAQAVLEALGQRLSTTGIPAAEPVVTPETMLLDVTAGLANVGQILDRQDRQLSQWEGEATPAAAAARLSAHYADAPMPAAILDADDRILWANNSFERHTGCSAAELGGMRWTQLVRGWSESADHLVYHHRYGHIESWQVQRWTASGCQVAVLHNPGTRTSATFPPLTVLGKSSATPARFSGGGSVRCKCNSATARAPLSMTGCSE